MEDARNSAFKLKENLINGNFIDLEYEGFFKEKDGN